MLRIESQGLSGQALSFSGEVITLELARAHAPGSPLDFSLEHDGHPLEFHARTVACTQKGAGPGMFRIRARLVNLRKEHRLMLAQSLSSAPSTAPRTES